MALSERRRAAMLSYLHLLAEESVLRPEMSPPEQLAVATATLGGDVLTVFGELAGESIAGKLRGIAAMIGGLRR